MKKNRFIPAVATSVAIGLFAAANAADKVTLRFLLAEMTDPDANTYLPVPRYTTCLWSSHDRRTTTPGADGWFANDDHSKFIRSETVGGRTEDVMLDVEEGIRKPLLMYNLFFGVELFLKFYLIRFSKLRLEVIENKGHNIFSLLN